MDRCLFVLDPCQEPLFRARCSANGNVRASLGMAFGLRPNFAAWSSVTRSQRPPWRFDKPRPDHGAAFCPYPLRDLLPPGSPFWLCSRRCRAARSQGGRSDITDEQPSMRTRRKEIPEEERGNNYLALNLMALPRTSVVTELNTMKFFTYFSTVTSMRASPPDMALASVTALFKLFISFTGMTPNA